MKKSEIDSPSHSPNPLALSVKSHTYYKDSIIADLFEHFCKPMLLLIHNQIGNKKMCGCMLMDGTRAKETSWIWVFSLEKCTDLKWWG